MCFERFTHLRCGHYESLKLETKSCYYSNTTKLSSPRMCPDYRQAVTREDKSRSCPRCKANMLAGIGVGTFSLGAAGQAQAHAHARKSAHAHAHAPAPMAAMAPMKVAALSR